MTILVLYLLSACTSGNQPPPVTQVPSEAVPHPGRTVSFAGISAPVTDAERRAVRASASVTVNGKPYPIAYHPILHTGDAFGDEVFGQLKNHLNQPLSGDDGSRLICDGTSSKGSGPDHSTILEKDGSLFLVSQMECQVGGFYVADLEQADDGALTPTGLRSVDFTEHFGGYVHCAGMRTPWGSHLSSEEYEPDARKLKPDGSVDGYYDANGRYWGETATGSAIAKGHPYYHGYVPELWITDANGTVASTKHYAMGRVAHELAYVMPDCKTVYLSDDGTNTGLYLFVADATDAPCAAGAPDALSTGTLYAAQWQQKSADNGGAADLAWISLGHATDAEVKAAIDARPAFTDLFEVAPPSESKRCPEGFTSVNTSAGHECLNVKPGQETVASRLETRRYAAMLGATTEFRKEEGITWDPDRNRLYVAMSRIEYGMENLQKRGTPSEKYDAGGPNHVQLPFNPCGGVYALDHAPGKRDIDDQPIASDWVMGSMSGLLVGQPKTYPEGSEHAGNTCDVDGLAEPDNLTYLPGTDVLVIGEDTNGHINDTVWAYDLGSKVLTRILTTPYGSETTSPFWYPNINGHGYLMTVVQHPYGESDRDKATGPDDTRSIVGYIGPFPALD
ncbi:MAG: alkaline phosphatase PhoX [Myxococcota bacterium]